MSVPHSVQAVSPASFEGIDGGPQDAVAHKDKKPCLLRLVIDLVEA